MNKCWFCRKFVKDFEILQDGKSFCSVAHLNKYEAIKTFHPQMIIFQGKPQVFGLRESLGQ